MKIFYMKQASTEWFDIRRGRPTASEFDRIITPVKGEKSKQSIGYARQLVGELKSLLYPKNAEWWTSRPMQHGIDYEGEARDWYRIEIAQEAPGAEVEEVGFCLSDCGRWGFSPDCLILSLKRGTEIKCPLKAEIQLERLEKGVLWPEVKVQVHGALAVAPEGWTWDAISYHPGLPALKIRVEFDDYTARVQAALKEFWETEYAPMLAKYGLPVEAFPSPPTTPDGEILGPDIITEAQYAALGDAMDARGFTAAMKQTMENYYKIFDLRHLPQSKFQHAWEQVAKRPLKETLP